jgi:N-methylhydantoinase B
VAGGQEGTTSFFEVVRTNGEQIRGGRVTNLPLAPGDLVRVTTGNGGGWGDARERERALVWDDLADGYVTEETAWEVYGLEVGAKEKGRE